MRLFAELLVVLLGITAFTAIAQEQQIYIKARFFEVPKETLMELQKISNVENDATKILTPEETAALLQEFNSNYSVTHLAEPEVVTTSGRRTQMRTTQVLTVVTNSTLQEISTNSGMVNDVVFETEKMEFGPVLDVISSVSSDGQKIELTTTASDTKFFGYADPGNSPTRFATNSVGQKINLPIILPVLQANQASAKVTVPDGQTLVLFPKAGILQDERLTQHVAQAEKKDGDKFLVALITPTIVDADGNRVHPGN